MTFIPTISSPTDSYEANKQKKQENANNNDQFYLRERVRQLYDEMELFNKR